MRSLKTGQPPDLSPWLMAIVEQWHGPLLLFDAEARLCWCNQPARQLVNNDRGDLIGRGAPSLGLPWIMAPEQFIAALSGSEQWFRAGPPETPRLFEVRLRRIELGAGSQAVLCTLEPQSEVNRAADSEREPFFDAAHAGLWRWDLENGEAQVDAAWCRHLNLEPFGGSDHTQRWASQIHPDDSPDYRRRMEEIRNGSVSVFEDEYRILTLDNRWIWILQRGRVVLRNVDGDPVKVVGICIDIDRRKREETASKENEGRLATALWGARAAFWQWHIPNDVRTMSPMWFAITGYSREKWDELRDPWISRVHAEDQEHVVAAVERYRSGQIDSLEYEYRMQLADGGWKWWLDRARAVEWDLDGNPTVIMGVSLDIDAQRRAEVDLHESEVRLQTAVWGARMGLWETDFTTNSTRWFDQWCAQYGIDPCEGADTHSRWLQNVHPADAAGAAQRYADHLAGKQDFYDAEYRVRNADGKWRWVYSRGRVTERDENQVPCRMVGVCMDIDARRRMEMQKHFTQPWIESALQVARCGMWHWQVEPHEVTYTDSYFRLFGFDPLASRATHTFVSEHLHPDDHDRVMAVTARLIAGRMQQSEQEYRMRCADGSWMWVLSRVCVINRDDRGRAQHLVGFAIDCTERRRQRETLRASGEVFRHATLAAGGMIVELDFSSGNLKRYGGEALLGYGSGEMPVRREVWAQMLHPDDRENFYANRGDDDVRGHDTVIEYRVQHRDGHYVRLRSAGATIRDEEGKPLRRISFLQEVPQ
jgi:PAS domain S-box-containing protein